MDAGGDGAVALVVLAEGRHLNVGLIRGLRPGVRSEIKKAMIEYIRHHRADMKHPAFLELAQKVQGWVAECRSTGEQFFACLTGYRRHFSRGVRASLFSNRG